MLIVNTGSVLLILWQDSANIIYQTPRPAVLWPNKPGMFIVDIYNNCIKLSAVSGCLLILSASVIAEEPYNRTTYNQIVLTYHRTIVPSCYPSYLVLSFASCFRLCIHSFIANRACASARRSAAGCVITYSNRVNRRCSWRSGHRRYFV